MTDLSPLEELLRERFSDLSLSLLREIMAPRGPRQRTALGQLYRLLGAPDGLSAAEQVLRARLGEFSAGELETTFVLDGPVQRAVWAELLRRLAGRAP